jgi:hypothetical protein
MSIPFHPLANIFPMLAPADLATLADDIAKHGQREAIIMHEGAILDGRNRYQACVMAGVEPVFKDFDGDDALAFVISANLHRRHLDDSQRAMIAAALENLGHGGNRQDANLHLEISRAAAATLLNVSPRTVASAAAVREHGAPALVAAVEHGEVSVSAAAHVATLPTDEQQAIVDAGPRAVQEAARTIRETPKEIVVAIASTPREGGDLIGKFRPLGPRIRNIISVPEKPDRETRLQKAKRLFLHFASEDMDVCNKIMRDLPFDPVDDISDLRSATHAVIEAWEKIDAALAMRAGVRTGARARARHSRAIARDEQHEPATVEKDAERLKLLRERAEKMAQAAVEIVDDTLANGGPMSQHSAAARAAGTEPTADPLVAEFLNKGGTVTKCPPSRRRAA